MSLLLKLCKIYTLKVFYFLIGVHRRWKSALNVQLLEQHPKQMNHCHALSTLFGSVTSWTQVSHCVPDYMHGMLCYVYSSHVGHSIVKDHTVPPSLWSKSQSSGTL